MLRIFLCFTIASLAILTTSCFKEDEQITPHIPGNYITDTVALTDKYTYQVYYRLQDSLSVLNNHKDSWDLGFENSADGWHVILNSSCFMKSAFLDGQDFGFPVDTTGAVWLFNPSDGSADSVVAGHWFDVNGNDTIGKNQLLLIDRGIDENGNPRGVRQLIIDSLVHGTYYFRLANMDGTNRQSYSVAKQGDVNFTYFSISKPTAVITEPLRSDWDLLFTQYTTLLYTDVGEPYPYLVTGVLLNPYSVEVAVDSLTLFDEMSFEKAKNMNFTRQADKIGYLWKKYDFDSGIYTVNPNMIFVIRDTKGFLYKLRFIGFYRHLNNKAEKGFPSFEYQRL